MTSLSSSRMAAAWLLCFPSCCPIESLRSGHPRLLTRAATGSPWCVVPYEMFFDALAGRVTDETGSLSSSRAPSLAPSPLRTGLEGFPFIRLEHSKRPPEQRGRGLIQNEADLLDTDLLPIRTAEGIPPAVCEAAPMAYAIVICFASCIGSSRVLELSTNRKSAPFPAR